MSGEGTAPSKHGRKPQKDVMDGKPAGGQTARATATDKQFKPSGKSPGKRKVAGKKPVNYDAKDKY